MYIKKILWGLIGICDVNGDSSGFGYGESVFCFCSYFFDFYIVYDFYGVVFEF